MGSLAVERHCRLVLSDVTWQDDLIAEWVDPIGVGKVSAVLDYFGADARIILRRGPNEMTLAAGLGERMSYSGQHMLGPGDEVVLQARALTPARDAISDVAALFLEAAAW